MVHLGQFDIDRDDIHTNCQEIEDQHIFDKLSHISSLKKFIFEEHVIFSHFFCSFLNWNMLIMNGLNNMQDCCQDKCA